MAKMAFTTTRLVGEVSLFQLEGAKSKERLVLNMQNTELNCITNLSTTKHSHELYTFKSINAHTMTDDQHSCA